MGKSKDLATGAAYQDQTESDARYVNVAGDTMTDTLNITSPSNARALKIQNGANNSASQITFLSHDGTEDSFIRNQASTVGQDSFAIGTGGSEKLRISSEGYVTTPNQLHILGTPKNSSGNGIANAFYTHTNFPPIGLSFSNSRITVPIAGVYLITYNAIADNGTGREDINILINGNAMAQSLTATNESGYRQNNVTNAIKLDANDYIQFDHDDWYNPSSTGYDAWMTASVTLLG